MWHVFVGQASEQRTQRPPHPRRCVAKGFLRASGATSYHGPETPGEGLRASEARLLRFADVDVVRGVLTICDAKGGKDRQVPVSEALRVRLADYYARVAGRTGGEWFFPGTNGRPLTLANIDKNFRRFLWQARIPHGGKGHGPRIHDLRHVFAVNNLRSWFERGEDVGAMLPVLQPTWVIPRSPTPTTT